MVKQKTEKREPGPVLSIVSASLRRVPETAGPYLERRGDGRPLRHKRKTDAENDGIRFKNIRTTLSKEEVP
jgi:hypothetical protein